MYTSGRTVKSSAKQVSPIAAATATGRKLARRHLPAHARPIISSKHVAGGDGTVRMQTEILFADLPAEVTKPLADAVSQLPRYSSMCWNLVSITYLCDLEG